MDTRDFRLAVWNADKTIDCEKHQKKFQFDTGTCRECDEEKWLANPLMQCIKHPGRGNFATKSCAKCDSDDQHARWLNRNNVETEKKLEKKLKHSRRKCPGHKDLYKKVINTYDESGKCSKCGGYNSTD